MVLIAANVAAGILETVESIRAAAPRFFAWFETASVLVFTVEYLLRLWACRASAEFRRPVVGRVKFAVTPLVVVDLIAILPFYLFFLDLDLRFIRALRLFRLFRVLKLARYTKSLRLLRQACVAKKEELLVVLSVISLVVVVSSSLMYLVEHAAQPQAFSSVPQAMWWSVATLTTVGYGDITPVTPAGKVIASIIALAGIAFFALPTAILGSGFLEELTREQGRGRRCPHCGKDLPS